MTDSRAVALDFLIGSSRHVETHPRGRVCAEKGCATILSIYNAEDRCDLHIERDELLTYYGKSFRVCPDCGLVAEIRKKHPSRKCGRCGCVWEVGT